MVNDPKILYCQMVVFQVEEEIGEVVMVLVQNKIDLIDDAMMTAEEVEEMLKI